MSMLLSSWAPNAWRERLLSLPSLLAAATTLATLTQTSLRAADRIPTNQYTADVEFLLRELPAKAGCFFGLKGIRWEEVSAQIGVSPHEIVPYDPAELAAGADTQIRRAEALLKAGLPKDRVLFRAEP